ncbi:MAG TPA: DNA methyltransferase [Pyrinomonadaceae bacterium]|nr:DNA methyltransferase [Pyrinomonadaceae bacterium]
MAGKPSDSMRIYHGDCGQILETLEPNGFQAIIADPPYFQVLLGESWDNQWRTEEDYLDWTKDWIIKAARLLKDDGLFFIFGQLGKREHLWLHLCSMATRKLQFHDMLFGTEPSATTSVTTVSRRVTK